MQPKTPDTAVPKERLVARLPPDPKTMECEISECAPQSAMRDGAAWLAAMARPSPIWS
jgi:hypothetical protein